MQDDSPPVKLISTQSEADEAVRKILSRSEPQRRKRPAPDVSDHPPQPPQPPQVVYHHHHQPHGGQAELQRSAEEILAGVRRPCHVTQVDSVQYLALAPAPSLELQRQEPGQEFRAVNLSTGQPAQNSFEVTVFDHQDAAITLSSLEQVRHHASVINRKLSNIFI